MCVHAGTIFKLFSVISHHTNLKRLVNLLLASSLLIAGVASANQDRSYLRLEQSQASEENDLTISTIGGLVFQENMQGHVDLSYLESATYGQGATLDFAGGYVFNLGVYVYLGLGVSLGYNWDDEGLITTYYPEAGLILDITKKIGISISQKRVFNLYGQDEDIIMLGLVFR